MNGRVSWSIEELRDKSVQVQRSQMWTVQVGRIVKKALVMLTTIDKD